MLKRSDEALVDAFVAAFAAFDDMEIFGDDSVEGARALEGVDEFGLRRWRPRRTLTSESALEGLYRQSPYGLPELFEKLLMRWRWAAVDLGAVGLLANPVGPDLAGFVGEVVRDRGLADVLLPAGFIQCGRVGGGSCDPVCFDISRGRTSGDTRVVQIDHEEILRHQRLGAVRELHPSFRDLVEQVVATAAESPRRAV